MNIQKNSVYLVDVVRQGSKGEGISFIEKFPIHIPNTIPGDKVKVKIIKKDNRRAFGKLLIMVNKSKSRVMPRCDISLTCGGCQLQHQSIDEQGRFKDLLLRNRLSRYLHDFEGFLKPILLSEDPWSFRNKMQFAFESSSDKGEVKIGLYASRSHRVVNMDSCSIMYPQMNEAIKAIRLGFKQHPLSVFDESSGKGVLRYVTLRYASSSNQLMVIFTLGQRHDLSEIFLSSLKDLNYLESIYVSIQQDRTKDHVIGEQLYKIYGENVIEDECLGIGFQISPLSFVQGNSKMVDVLYQLFYDLLDWDGHDKLIDLYCGIGVLTMFFALKGKHVTGVDLNSAAIQDAIASSRLNGSQASFVCESAESYLLSHDSRQSVVVLDPPRKGCDINVLKALIQSKPKKVGIISCNPETLGRDLKLLVEGGFDITCIQPVDMFCHTVHLEVIVIGGFR